MTTSSSRTSRLLLCAAILAAALCTSCSIFGNAHDRKQQLMVDYKTGHNTEMAPWIEEQAKDRGEKEEVMWRLEGGSLAFYTGRHQDAVDNFKRAEELIDEYDGRATVSVRDVAATTGSLLLNDNTRPYRGSCRDRIALCFYKSLAYLGTGREDAFRAQIRRLRDAQKAARDQIDAEAKGAADNAAQDRQDNPNVTDDDLPSMEAIAGQSQNKSIAKSLEHCRQLAADANADFLNPAALFLSGLSSLRDGRADAAAIDFRQAVAAQPGSLALKQYLKAAMLAAGQKLPADLKEVPGVGFPLDRQCVYVLFGHGHTAALEQVSLILPLPGGLVPAAFALCQFYPSPFSGLDVTTADGVSASTRLADMDAIMAQEYQLALPAMITRIVLKAAIYAVSQEVIRRSDMNSLAKAASLLALSATAAVFNSTDTRCWELLPKELQLAQLPMPKDRKVQLALKCHSAPPISIPVEIAPGAGSAILYVNAPTRDNISVQVLPLAR